MKAVHYSNKYNASTPTCIDLFCGAGGLTLGFTQAGGLPIAAVDNDMPSITTYQAMFPMCKEVYRGDIRLWNPNPKKRRVDFVIGGPPCQGFSLARGLRFVDDPRNALYKEFVRIVSQVMPRWMVMENVPGIMNIGDGIIYKQIYEDFAAIGYRIECKIINMEEYGVPQSRKRAVFVGTSSSTKIPWPAPSRSKKAEDHSDLFNKTSGVVTIHDALSDLPWPMGHFFSHRANSQMRGPRNRNVLCDTAFTLRVRGDEFAMCERPASSAFVPGSLPVVRQVLRSTMNDFQDYIRHYTPHWIKEALPLPVNKQPVSWLKGTRRLAIREQARLQTFPDWFAFSGSEYRQASQIGNAVPPLFGKVLFEALLQAL
jgi:DNA (cytosine-5)-methyltransferase 1